MKKLLKLGIVGSIIGVIFFIVVLRLTAPIAEKAEEFLFLMQYDRLEEAYGLFSNVTKSAVDEGTFTSAMSQMHWENLESVSWGNRKISSGKGYKKGYLEGKISAYGGGYRFVSFELLKEGEEWKIYSVDFSPMYRDS